MTEELIRKYQETISLLQYRNPSFYFNGSFEHNDSGKIAYRLVGINLFDSEQNSSPVRISKTFKYMDSTEKALEYFIKTAQNRVF